MEFARRHVQNTHAPIRAERGTMIMAPATRLDHTARLHPAPTWTVAAAAGAAAESRTSSLRFRAPWNPPQSRSTSPPYRSLLRRQRPHPQPVQGRAAAGPWPRRDRWDVPDTPVNTCSRSLEVSGLVFKFTYSASLQIEMRFTWLHRQPSG